MLNLIALTLSLSALRFQIFHWVESAGLAIDPANTEGPNQLAKLGPSGYLVINEWLANPTPGQSDWLEIYNPSGCPFCSTAFMWDQ